MKMQMPKLFEVLIVLASFSSTTAQNPRRTVFEGTIVGKTVQFDENEFINITKYVDAFQVRQVKLNMHLCKVVKSSKCSVIRDTVLLSFYLIDEGLQTEAM